MTNQGLDTDTEVFFYEQEFYPLSNFSSFRLLWRGVDFDTSEHAYHWSKFDIGAHPEQRMSIRSAIRLSRSAHDAYRVAHENQSLVRPDWTEVRVLTMRAILFAKVTQHPYVLRKLLQTGDRRLVENSWRDPFWGWGPNRDGENMLGKLWMQVRAQMTGR